jgi:hypothetical protein
MLRCIALAPMVFVVMVNLCTGLPHLLAQRTSENPPPDAATIENSLRQQTASTHPMKYYVSLPQEWSSDKTWPVLVVPNAHYAAKPKMIERFAPLRDVRKSRLILVQPVVINADPVRNVQEYRGPVMDVISAADAAPAAEGRDEAARAKFDSEGILAVMRDVRELYHAEARFYIAGFSASTHIAYMFLFAHPEVLKGVVINSGMYVGRGVDEDRIPLRNSPVRVNLDVLYLVGAKDPHYETYLANWRKSREQLMGYGHPTAKMREETIQAGNRDGLSPGHDWYPAKILNFCDAVEPKACQ